MSLADLRERLAREDALRDERPPEDEREMRLDGCSWERPEGSTVDPRTGLLWGERS